ncbi:hypothetical protein HMSSN139_64790 [Paenibacillus sp. HMSSN-139]|nr:hypothetical protein HMSSN139_64790 [Paenibacillus sp. HMSSN-139]
MSIWESILVALDNLRMNKLRSFLTMIGIVFGVAAVVTVVSIGQAGQSSIMSEMSNYEDGYFLIYPNYNNGDPDDNVYFRQRELAEIRKLPGVRYVSASSTYGMTGKLKKENLQFSITGTTAESPKMQKSISWQAGSLTRKRSGHVRRPLWSKPSMRIRRLGLRKERSGGKSSSPVECSGSSGCTRCRRAS